jgi:hypothetical protein
MIFQSKFSVGSFDLIEGGCFGDSESVVVGIDGIGVVFVEEFLLFLVHGSVFVEELLEGGMGILQRVLAFQDLIIVGSFVPV